jgi:hypothetical protein
MPPRAGPSRASPRPCPRAETAGRTDPRLPCALDGARRSIHGVMDPSTPDGARWSTHSHRRRRRSWGFAPPLLDGIFIYAGIPASAEPLRSPSGGFRESRGASSQRSAHPHDWLRRHPSALRSPARAGSNTPAACDPAIEHAVRGSPRNDQTSGIDSRLECSNRRAASHDAQAEGGEAATEVSEAPRAVRPDWRKPTVELRRGTARAGNAAELNEAIERRRSEPRGPRRRRCEIRRRARVRRGPARRVTRAISGCRSRTGA